ncbi:MAG: hypothetical protein ABW019_07700 [Chitinophagaceae bacterium]
MSGKIMIICLLLVLTGSAAAQSTSPRRTDHTVAAVKKWAEENKNHSTWQGWLLYQGSDSLRHHFISRIMDGWAWFTIRREELKLTDERVHKTGSSAPLGYYYVDAINGFVKVKDY